MRHGIKKAWATVALISVELIIVTGGFFIALTGFVYLARMVFWKKRETLDQKVFGVLENHVTDVNTGIMNFFTILGTHTFLIPANLLLIAYFLFIRKHRWYSIKIPVISISSLLLMFLLKQIFHRQRPLVPLLEPARGMSFPSGHALNSMVFYGLLIYIIHKNIENNATRKTLILCLLLLIFLIGASRVYLRVHYASDVLAGFSMGLIWLILSVHVLNKMERFSKKEIDLVVEK
ncbi:MAG: phosphatase family protein [Segetibacter sp.]|nr:phosphatase family protein [Segetibacter sp.]